MTDPYAIRCEAERIIGEDRVPTEVLERLIADYGEPAPEFSYHQVCLLAGDLCGDFANAEYVRGQAELIGDMFPQVGVALGDRLDTIVADMKRAPYGKRYPPAPAAVEPEDRLAAVFDRLEDLERAHEPYEDELRSLELRVEELERRTND